MKVLLTRFFYQIFVTQKKNRNKDSASLLTKNNSHQKLGNVTTRLLHLVLKLTFQKPLILIAINNSSKNLEQI